MPLGEVRATPTFPFLRHRRRYCSCDLFSDFLYAGGAKDCTKRCQAASEHDTASRRHAPSHIQLPGPARQRVFLQRFHCLGRSYSVTCFRSLHDSISQTIGCASQGPSTHRRPQPKFHVRPVFVFVSSRQQHTGSMSPGAKKIDAVITCYMQSDSCDRYPSPCFVFRIAFRSTTSLSTTSARLRNISFIVAALYRLAGGRTAYFSHMGTMVMNFAHWTTNFLGAAWTRMLCVATGSARMDTLQFLDQ